MGKKSSTAQGLSSPVIPLFPEVGVVNLVSETWGGIWLSRHQILTRLSRYFNILWFNPPREWRDVWLKGDSAAPRNGAAQPPANGFIVHSHSTLFPKFYRPAFIVKLTTAMRFRTAERVLRKAGCDKTILYIWNDEFAESLDQVHHDISCYHITDEYSFSDIEKPLSKCELDLVSRVDQVFIHSPALMEKKGSINPNTLFVPNGVDYRLFSAGHAEPADLAAIPHPRIGYVGRIKKQLDWDVLSALVGSRPAYSFVFVGPIGFMGDETERMESLFGKKNVFYLGNKPVGDVPAYMQHMDVGLLCYVENDYTKYIFPLKLHEYLAAGLPVVGSNIRSLKEFSSVVRIAEGAGDWFSAIDDALKPEAGSQASIDRRRRVAREHDWHNVVHAIARSLCERLGEEYSARLEVFDREDSGQ